MHGRPNRLIAAAATAALVVAACGGDRENTTSGSSSTSSTTGAPSSSETTTTEPTGPTFGDLAWPCGPGDGSGTTAQGVTDETITIGVGDDRGFAGSPGLNKPQTDAVLAMIDECNELGGIDGRQIEPVVYDAALFDVTGVMTEACQQVFMLVGQGFALDEQGEETRIACGLASVPGFSVSAVASHGPRMYQSVPNPADQQTLSEGALLKELFPDKITKAATLFANFVASQETTTKLVAGLSQIGYEFPVTLEYNVLGEEDWTPFALQLRDGGAEMVYYSGGCSGLQLVMRAGVNNGYEPVWFTEANGYDQLQCADINTDGAMDGLYVRLSYIPFEEADQVKAVADLQGILADAGVAESLLGMQGAASFLLWATGAAACGSDLTADCVLDEIAQIEDWTAGGLHVPTTPKDNATAECGLLLQLVGSTYERVLPEEPGTFECDAAWAVEVQTAAADAAALDANRVSTRFQG